MSYYDFIPVNSTKPASIPDKLFSSRKKIKEAISWTIQFITLSNVHVGSGKKGIESSQHYPREISFNYRRGNGTPAIPGSTLKGMVRTNYHILTASAEKTSELFGTTIGKSAISKVFFRDVVPQNRNVTLENQTIYDQWSPRKRRKNHIKVYVASAPPPDYPPRYIVESFPKGTILVAKGVYLGNRKWEIGGILYSMGIHLDNNDTHMVSKPIKLGYAKPQMLGRLKAIINESSPMLTKFNLGSFPPELVNYSRREITEALKAFKEHHLQQSENNVAKVFKE